MNDILPFIKGIVILPLLIEPVVFSIVDGEVLSIVLLKTFVQEGTPTIVKVGSKPIVDLL